MSGSAELVWRQPISTSKPSSEHLAELGEWFLAEHGPLVRFATIVCGDRYIAEDLVQEAFVRTSLAGARLDLPMGAYTRRTIVNLSNSRFRRRAAERRAYSRLTRDEVVHPPAEHRDAMWDAIQQLSPRQRAVIALRFYEDLSERDIASMLGISTGNVKKHASRAVGRLRTLLQDRRPA
jgi:RNA polymerase sigma factor (sigma-70 family)